MQVDEITFGDVGCLHNVRVTPTGQISCIDWTMVLSGLDNNSAGLKWRLFVRDQPEVHQSVVKYKFPGQRPTDVINLDGALRMAMLMSGKGATAYRDKACSILKRYFAGDASMHAELEANAASDAPLPTLARAALAGDAKREPDEIVEGFIIKRRRVEAERLLAEEESVLARIKREEEAAAVKIAREEHMAQYHAAMQVLKTGLEYTKLLEDFSGLDVLRANIKTRMLNVIEENSLAAVPGPGRLAIEAPVSQGIVRGDKTIAEVASGEPYNITDNAVHGRIGKLAVRAYREKHRRDPRRANEIKDPIAGKHVLNLTTYIYTPDEVQEFVVPAIKEYLQARELPLVAAMEAVARRYNAGRSYFDAPHVIPNHASENDQRKALLQFVKDVSLSVQTLYKSARGSDARLPTRKQTVQARGVRVNVAQAPVFDEEELLESVLKPAIEQCMRARNSM